MNLIPHDPLSEDELDFILETCSRSSYLYRAAASIHNGNEVRKATFMAFFEGDPDDPNYKPPTT